MYNQSIHEHRLLLIVIIIIIIMAFMENEPFINRFKTQKFISTIQFGQILNEK